LPFLRAEKTMSTNKHKVAMHRDKFAHASRKISRLDLVRFGGVAKRRRHYAALPFLKRLLPHPSPAKLLYNPADVITMWKRARDADAIETARPSPFTKAPMPPVSSQRLATAMTEYRLPATEQQTRKRSFVVRQVPLSTLNMTKALVAEVNATTSKNIAITKVFYDFVAVNDTPKGTVELAFLFLLFFIDITLQGLGISSAITYARGVLGVESRAGRRIEGPYVDDLFKILNLLQSSEEVDHAADVTLEQAWKIVDLLTDELQMLCWLMVVTGARAKDLQRMTFSQFTFHMVNGRPQMKVHFRYTKGRR